MSKIECPWCGCEINVGMDCCGTGTTWSLFCCKHCGKHTIYGRYIPPVAIEPDTRVITLASLTPQSVSQ